MKTILFTLKDTARKANGSGGGGCFFVKNLSNFLIEKGYNVVYKLQDSIDLIILIDPRKNSTNNFSVDQIIEYKKKNPNVKIIHRVNECDSKREKSINIEPLLVKTMNIADHVVFITNWLREYFIQNYSLNLNNSVIINGCNQEYFNTNNKKKKQLSNPIKLVTHHWSDNYLKGFKIYNEIDKLNSEKFKLTFIGNYNKNYSPQNINVLPPCNGHELANEIKKHDIYLTASQNEPCGMHQLEGMSCGLPLLYCTGSGGIKETCVSGEEFNDISTLIEKMNKIKNNYEHYVSKINNFILSSDRCNNEFLQLIKNVLN